MKSWRQAISRRKSAGQDTPAPATSDTAPPPTPLAEYQRWVAEAEEAEALTAAAEAAIAANPDTLPLRREHAYAASVAELTAVHRARMDALREDEAARRHALAASARRRRIETAAEDGEIDWRLSERDEARDRRRRIMAARAAHDPAIAAADMTRDGQRYVRTYTRISLAGAALAAVGLGSAAMGAGLSLPVAIGAGVLGEVVLTLLITQIIGGRAALHARQGLARDREGTLIAAAVPRWAVMLPWVGVGALLTASVAINVHGSVTGHGGAQLVGALGALGACIAALATALAWGYSVETSATVGTLLSDHGIQSGLADLDTIASGARLRDLVSDPAPASNASISSSSPSLESQPEGPSRAAILAALADDPTLISEAVSAELDGLAEAIPSPAPNAPNASDVEDTEDESLESGAVAIADRPAEDVEDTDAAPRAAIADRATATAAANRAAVRDALADLERDGQPVTAAAIARVTGLSDRTVRRHLTAITDG